MVLSQLHRLDTACRIRTRRCTRRGNRPHRRAETTLDGSRAALGATGLVIVALFATAVPSTVAGATSAGLVSYEADCTVSLEAGEVAPFTTSLNGNTTVSTASATGASFGFKGTASTVVIGALVANLYANGVGANPLTLQWDETIGHTDAHATGTYAFTSPVESGADGGGKTPPSKATAADPVVTWTKGSTTLKGNFSAAKVGDSVASTKPGLASTATITAITGTTSATISAPTTATAATATAATVGWGVDTTLSDTKLNTGSVFKTAGGLRGTAGVGVLSATEFTVSGFPSSAARSGTDPKTACSPGMTRPTPWPGQTGGVTATVGDRPVLPAGSTTPLVAISPQLGVLPGGDGRPQRRAGERPPR